LARKGNTANSKVKPNRAPFKANAAYSTWPGGVSRDE